MNCNHVPTTLRLTIYYSKPKTGPQHFCKGKQVLFPNRMGK